MNKTMVSLQFSKYEELTKKAARLDTLTEIIKAEIDKGSTFPVKDEIVLEFIGLNNYKAGKENHNDV